MSEKIADKEHSLEALREMISERKPSEPVEEVLTVFCQRYGLSMVTCRAFYDELVAKGKIEEK